MDIKLMMIIESYISFLKTQYSGDKILTCTYEALVNDNLDFGRNLGEKDYMEILNNIANFSYSLYTKAPGMRPYARHYIILLVKELTKLGKDKDVIKLLEIVYKYDKRDGLEVVIINASKKVQEVFLRAKRITNFIKDAINGAICGAIIGAGYIAVRMWLKI